MLMQLKVPLAETKDDRVIAINEYTESDRGKIFCPDCDSLLTVKRGEEKRHHFAHLPDTGCSGETAEHNGAKLYLARRSYEKTLKIRCEQGLITFVLIFDPIEIGLTEQRIYGKDGDYRDADVQLIDAQGNIIYLEVWYKNKKKNVDERFYLDNDLTVAEIDIRDLDYSGGTWTTELYNIDRWRFMSVSREYFLTNSDSTADGVWQDYRKSRYKEIEENIKESKEKERELMERKATETRRKTNPDGLYYKRKVIQTFIESELPGTSIPVKGAEREAIIKRPENGEVIDANFKTNFVLVDTLDHRIQIVIIMKRAEESRKEVYANIMKSENLTTAEWDIRETSFHTDEWKKTFRNDLDYWYVSPDYFTEEEHAEFRRIEEEKKAKEEAERKQKEAIAEAERVAAEKRRKEALEKRTESVKKSEERLKELEHQLKELQESEEQYILEYEGQVLEKLIDLERRNIRSEGYYYQDGDYDDQLSKAQNELELQPELRRRYIAEELKREREERRRAKGAAKVDEIEKIAKEQDKRNEKKRAEKQKEAKETENITETRKQSKRTLNPKLSVFLEHLQTIDRPVKAGELLDVLRTNGYLKSISWLQINIQRYIDRGVIDHDGQYYTYIRS